MPKLPPRYLDTVAIFEAYRHRKLHYAATGFFCRYFTGGAGGRTLLFLVTTARAVSGNLSDTRLVCRRRRGFRRTSYAAGGKGGLALGTWLVDAERDVAVLPLDPDRLSADAIRYQTFDVSGGALNSWQMGHRGIGEGDDVLLLGFTPERVRFRPVTMVRRGIIARIQDCYRGQSPTFLVDATIFAGNTGETWKRFSNTTTGHVTTGRVARANAARAVNVMIHLAPRRQRVHSNSAPRHRTMSRRLAGWITIPNILEAQKNMTRS